MKAYYWTCEFMFTRKVGEQSGKWELVSFPCVQTHASPATMTSTSSPDAHSVKEEEAP